MAMVVLEVGLMGVAGTLVLAARNMRRAAYTERVITEAAALYDSLAALPVPGEGEVVRATVHLRWTVSAEGAVRLDALAPGDSVILTIRGRALMGLAP